MYSWWEAEKMEKVVFKNAQDTWFDQPNLFSLYFT